MGHGGFKIGFPEGVILFSLEAWRESSISPAAHLAGRCKAAAAHNGWPEEEVGVDRM